MNELLENSFIVFYVIFISYAITRVIMDNDHEFMYVSRILFFPVVIIIFLIAILLKCILVVSRSFSK